MTLALTTSVLSLIGLLAPQALKFVNLHSRTSGFFRDVDSKQREDRHLITVTLTNEGGRSAEVQSARIDFKRSDGRPSSLASADLDIQNRSAMIVRPSATVDLALWAENVMAAGTPPVTAASSVKDDFKLKLAEELCNTDAVVNITVRERSRFNILEPPTPIPMPLTRDGLQVWVLERTTGKPPINVGCP